MIGGGELEGKLSAMIEQLGLSNEVRLLGPQPQRSVKEFIQQAAVMAARACMVKMEIATACQLYC